jgi:hypothetical protein
MSNQTKPTDYGYGNELNQGIEDDAATLANVLNEPQNADIKANLVNFPRGTSLQWEFGNDFDEAQHERWNTIEFSVDQRGHSGFSWYLVMRRCRELLLAAQETTL